MKKLRYIITILTVMIALVMSVDDSFSFYSSVNATQIPFQTGNSDASHHHSISISDHFFQKSSVLFSNSGISIDLDPIQKDQPKFSFFLSSIWQPPKRTC